MQIAFIGLGVMGSPMAQHLMRAGHQLTVYTRTKDKAQEALAMGAQWADNPAQAVKGADCVITMLGYPKDVEEVYLNADGVVANAKSGALVIDMTTTSPTLWQKIAAIARDKGLRPLDAPVSGGDSGARNATLSIMVGGKAADFEAAMPLFETMGKTITHMGDDGMGQHTKMANQIAIAGTVCGVAEAITYAKKAGIDPDSLLAAIGKGAAGSWQMSNNGPKMIQGDCAPGFFIKHFVKDMGLANDEAQLRQLSLPVLEMVLGFYKQMEDKGDGELGTQAIYTHYEA